MVTEEIVYKVLDALYKSTKVTHADVKMSKEDFNDALDIICDCNYAKNIRFSKGTMNQILIAFYDNAKITLDGLHFLNGYRQPSTVAENEVFILEDGATWTARAGSRITFRVIDTDTLVEIAGSRIQTVV